MRRRLVSVVVSNFDGEFAEQPLTFAPKLGRDLVGVLAGYGYQSVPEGGGIDLTHDQIAALVHDTITTAGPDDVLIVHLLSHGREVHDSVMIVGADGRSSGYTSVDSWILDSSDPSEQEDPELGAGSSSDKPLVLFLVDVCGAGSAARQSFQQKLDDERRRAWVLAGCLPKRAGYNGHFTEAFAAVLADIARRDPHFAFPYIPLQLIARAVRQKVKELAAERNTYEQRVIGTRIDLAADDLTLPFFPNPAYRASVIGSVPAELRDIVAAVDALVDPWHFANRASGRPDHGTRLLPGCFRGRSHELATITRWLSRQEAGTLLAVTGSPGIGKSAVIGMVVCAAHADLADVTEKLWWDRRHELPPAKITHLVAIHARETPLAAILQSIARQLRVPDADREWSIEALVAVLSQLTPVPVIVVDALDEAVNPAAVMAAVLTFADTRRPDGTPVCRLLVGTRSGTHWPAFQPLCGRARETGNLIDLDDVPRGEVLQADLQGYVDDLLRADATYGSQPLLPARGAIARSVATALSAPLPDDGQPHWGEFLVAAVFVNHLVRLPAIENPALASARASAVPRTLPEVFDLDLSGLRSPWLLPVLTTVAHAFGAGMPKEVIQHCCTAFADPSLGEPTDVDITGALSEVRFYIRHHHETDGTTLYRLFHQALADHLQRKAQIGHAHSDSAGHARILDRLFDMVAYQPGVGGEWEEGLTAPYLLRHAIDHAAACGRVSELLDDPQFLVHADPASLARQIRLANTKAAHRAARVYRSSLYRHLHSDAADRRSVLALDAARHGQHALARQLATVPAPFPPMSWVPTWSTGCQASASLVHVLDGHPDGATSVAVTVLSSGTPVAVSCGADGTARVWDLIDGVLRSVLSSGTGHVNQVVCTRLSDGTPAAATVGDDGYLRLWTIPDGVPLAEKALTSGSAITAAASLRTDGGDRIVCGDGEGRLHICGPDGDLVLTVQAHDCEITAVACTKLTNGDEVAVSAAANGAVAVWALDDGRTLHRLSGHSGWVGAVTCFRLTDRTDIAVTTGEGGVAEVWDLAAGRQRRSIRTVHAWLGPAACAHVPDLGTDMVVVPGAGATAEVHDLNSDGNRYTFTGHRDWVGQTICVGLSPKTPVAVTTSGDGTARVWDLTNGSLRSSLAGHTDSITSVAHLRTVGGNDVLVTTSMDGSIRVWDLGVDAGGATSHAGHADVVTGLAASRGHDGVPTVISSSRDGTARIWRSGDGAYQRVLTGRGDSMSAVAAGRDGTDARLVIADLKGLLMWRLADLSAPPVRIEMPATITGVACGQDAAKRLRIVAATAWGRQVLVWPGPDGELGMRPEHEGMVRAVAWATLHDGAVVLTASNDRTAAAWDPDSGRLRYTMVGHTDQVTAVAVGCDSDRLGIVVTGGQDNSVRCWRLDDGRPLCSMDGHSAPVTAVACTDASVGHLAASTSEDRTVRIWDLDSRTCIQIIMLPEAAQAVTFGDDGELLVGFGWEVARYEPIRLP